MKLPSINSIFTLRDNIGNLFVPKTDSAGRFLVNVSNSIQPIVGQTPPTSPSDGDMWFNNSPNYNQLFSYSATLGLWIGDYFNIPFGEDYVDGGRLAFAGMNSAGSATGLILPKKAILVDLTAKIRSGNQNKGFMLQVNGATQFSFNLTNGSYVGHPNLQLNTNQSFWIRGNGAGSGVSDITMLTFWRWIV